LSVIKHVSVVVPIFNAAKWLDRCITSLVNQSLDEIEIILVNDGSTDSSQVIIDKFSREYPDKVISTEISNCGLSVARNVGIALASGEYLAFVDSDDWVDLDAFERLHQQAVQTDSDVVSFPVSYVYETTVTRTYFSDYSMSLFGLSVSQEPRLLIAANSFAWNKIYRREFLAKSNFEFPVGQVFEDSAAIYNLLAYANRVECVNIPFYYYDRTGVNSITKTVGDHIFDIFKSCDSILTFYRDQPDTCDLQDTMEFLCIRHLFVRIDFLSRSNNIRFVQKFVSAVYKYLETNIPNWRDNSYFRSASFSTSKKLYLRKRPRLAKIYYTTPFSLRRGIWGVISAFKRFLKNVRRSFPTRSGGMALEAANRDQAQRAAIKKYGLKLIVVVQRILSRHGIQVFADFGSLLGLAREGRLLAHDLDIELGVIANDSRSFNMVRMAMERYGFKISSEYYLGQVLVESSFTFLGLTVVIRYYEGSEESSRTWLLFGGKGERYSVKELNVVEINHSSIYEVVTIEASGLDINVPSNYEQLLTEKYGAGWEMPDTSRIYWHSPSGQPISERGRFVTYDYRGGPNGPWDCRDRLLFEEFLGRPSAF